MTLEFLQISWFLLIGLLLSVYAVLDGFDLGVGIVHFISNKNREEERSRNIKLIAPFWDGNEVWLLTGAGALFAAFPAAYATIFSAFYIPLMFVIFSLIFRAVSIEFRDKYSNSNWKKFFDYAFSYSSMLVTFLFGVAMANIIRGLPLDSLGNYTGDIFFLLNPYALLVGITVVFMFANHGALYLSYRNDMEYSETEKAIRIRGLAALLWIPFNVCYFISGAITIINFQRDRELIIISMLFFVLSVVAMFLNRYYNYKKKDLYALAFSSLTILLTWALILSTLFPYIVPTSSSNVFNVISIFNSSSSKNTLSIMLYLAMIGMPVVIFYTIYIYRVFVFRKH
ncbi:MAG: cytochrome d ubiquinol oxidase subunit II [Oligoflexia bacterium]|nr:cytochrome d ubiquinol oxidase subunit II [Oligoflexia bacterium]